MASEDEGAEPREGAGVVQTQRCGGQLGWQAQSKGGGPGTEGHRGAKPWEPSNRPNWENEDLTPG